MGNLLLLAQEFEYESEVSGGVGAVMMLVWLSVAALMIVAMWRIFTKAGQPGWAAIVPIYNYYVMLVVVGRPWWYLLLYFIPIVNIVIYIMVMIDLAKSFGKGGGFAAGLIILPFIFLPILGFGSAQYQGPAAAPQAA
jgi:hypothetical protein